MMYYEMDDAMRMLREQAWEEVYEEAVEKGKLKKAREIAVSLSEMGLSPEQIAQAVKVNIDTVQEWLAENAMAVQECSEV